MPRFTSYYTVLGESCVIVEVLPKQQVKVRYTGSSKTAIHPFDSLTAEWSAKWSSAEHNGLTNDQVRSKLRRKVGTKETFEDAHCMECLKERYYCICKYRK